MNDSCSSISIENLVDSLSNISLRDPFSNESEYLEIDCNNTVFRNCVTRTNKKELNTENNLQANSLSNYNQVQHLAGTQVRTENINIFEENMAQLSLTIDPLKYLGKLPEFFGDYRDLQNFCDLIDKIHPLLLRYDALSQSIFSDVIKSKLRGKAREVIEINNHVTSWLEMKETLINNFGERASLEELFDRLKGITFKTTCVDFYNEIKTALRRLNVKTKLSGNGDLEMVEHAINNNKNSALLIFKNKVPEPMRSILYCRNPDSLETAMDILHEAGYAHYNINAHKTTYQNSNKHIRNNSNSNNNRNRLQDNRNNQHNYNTNFNNNHQDFTPFRNHRNNHIQNQRWQRPQNQFSNRNNQTTNTSFPHFRSRNIPESPFRNSFPENPPQNPYQNRTFGNPQYNQQNQLPPPEPMDINVAEAANKPPLNFPLQASTTNYPIS